MQKKTRSGFLVGLLSVGVLITAAMTSSLAQAASSNGPYYAEPAWDQKLPVATRFVLLTDWGSNAVLDRETGLVWEQSVPSTAYAWGDARLQCTSRTTGARKGWRLPSVHELASLVDPATIASSGDPLPAGHPFLPQGHPFGSIPLAGAWSATTDADAPTSAWFVVFSSGNVTSGNKAFGLFPAWCVRGGMNANQY